MTKRHFIRAAEIVRSMHYQLPGENSRTRAEVVASAFIKLFRAYNDRFDTDRFLNACGLQEKP